LGLRAVWAIIFNHGAGVVQSTVFSPLFQHRVTIRQNSEEVPIWQQMLIKTGSNYWIEHNC